MVDRDALEDGVAGSREGCVNSWRRAGGTTRRDGGSTADGTPGGGTSADGAGGGAGGGRAAFARRCRNLRADQGPVGAVLLLPGGGMLGVYQARPALTPTPNPDPYPEPLPWP